MNNDTRNMIDRFYNDAPYPVSREQAEIDYVDYCGNVKYLHESERDAAWSVESLITTRDEFVEYVLSN